MAGREGFERRVVVRGEGGGRVKWMLMRVWRGGGPVVGMRRWVRRGEEEPSQPTRWVQVTVEVSERVTRRGGEVGTEATESVESLSSRGRRVREENDLPNTTSPPPPFLSFSSRSIRTNLSWLR